MNSEKLLAYVGGTPGCGTMHLAAFLHLHEDVFCFNSSGGAVESLRSRWGMKDSPPAAFQFSESVVVEEYEKYISALARKNASITQEEAFSKRILAIRDDECFRAFQRVRVREEKARHAGSGAHSGRFERRRPLYVYPTRRNLEELYWTWNKGIHNHKELSIEMRIESFQKRLLSYWMEVSKLKKKYASDVLIVNVCDPDDRKAEYRKLLSFLSLEACELQENWIEENPRTNTFGDKVRSCAKSLMENDFYKEHIA